MSTDDSLSKTLTQSQRDKSLSSRRRPTRKKKKHVKPVLCPIFGPAITQASEGEGVFADTFERELTHATTTDSDQTIFKDTRSSLTLGVNVTYRNLEKNKVAAVVIASDVTPVTLIDHIIHRCEARNVPVTRLQHLRKLTKEKMKFTCICIGLLKNNPLWEKSIACLEKSHPSKVVPTPPEPKIAEEVKPVTEIHDVPLRKFVYLKRVSKTERAFIPESIIVKAPAVSSASEDFIKLSSQEFTIDKSVASGISCNIMSKRKKRKLGKSAGNEPSSKKPKKNQPPSFLTNMKLSNVKKFRSHPQRRRNKFKKQEG